MGERVSVSPCDKLIEREKRRGEIYSQPERECVRAYEKVRGRKSSGK